MVSLEFFIDINLPAYYDPRIDSASNRNEYQAYFLGDTGGRFLRLKTLPPSFTDCLAICNPSTSWNPQGLSRPVMGLLYLLLLSKQVIYFLILFANKSVKV